MQEKLLTADAAGSLPLWFLTESELPRWLSQQPAPVASWVRAHAFQAERHRALAYPGPEAASAARSWDWDRCARLES